MPAVVAPTIFTSTKAVMSSVMGVWGTTTPTLTTVYGYNFAASGDYFSTPDSVANSITGDISFVVDCALDDWTPAAVNTLVSKDGVSAATRSYAFNIQPTTGYPSLNFSTDGTTIISVTADAAPAVADGGRIHVGVQREASTGQVKFYTSPDHVTWTQLGTTQTGATGAIFDSTTQVHFGNLTSTSLSLAGKIYDSEIYSGLYFTGSATLKVDFDPADWSLGTTWTSVDTGEVWTCNGAVAISTMTLATAFAGDGAVFSLDATTPASVTDAQLFKNLVASPADGSSTQDYDFCLGTNTTPSTDDPTGVNLGTTNGYYSLDGGDGFRLHGSAGYTNYTQPALPRQIHRTTGGASHTMIIAGQFPAMSGDNKMYGTKTSLYGANGLCIGASSYNGTVYASRASAVSDGQGANGFANTYRVLAFSVNAAVTGTGGIAFYNNSSTPQGTYLNTGGASDPDKTLWVGSASVIGDAGGLANGTKIKAIAMLNRTASATDFSKVKAILNTQHGGIY